MIPIHFYHTADPYGFLSNFAAAPIWLDGAAWPASEHYYQAQKFLDPARREAIRAARTPGEAKSLAWAAGHAPRQDWDSARDEVMLAALRAKFTQHPDLLARLLATGDTILVEHTTNDHYWGDGGDGSGQNRLGALLMQVRAELRAQSESPPNRIIFDWLFDAGKIALRRGPLFDSVPPSHQAPVAWDRVEGMLLGLAIGDALGNTSESMLPHDRLRHYGEIRDYRPNRYAGDAGVGLPSDDSQLAFWMLEQLNQDEALSPENLAQRFSQQQIFGIGGTVREFLSNFKQRRLPWYACGPPSAGNGALMRIAPVLIPHLHAPGPDLWVVTALAAMLTHNDSASTAACLAFVAILWDLLGRQDPPPPYWWLDTYVAIARDLESGKPYTPRGGQYADYTGPLWQFVAERVSDAHDRNLSVLDACNGWYSGAYLMETLPSVLYIAMRHGDDFEAAIVRAVNDTRDNDTIAAIVGAALGALHGTAAIPERWRSRLLGRLGADDDGRLFDLLADTRRLWMAAN